MEPSESQSLQPRETPVKNYSTGDIGNMDKSLSTKGEKRTGMQAGAAEEEVRACFIKAFSWTQKRIDVRK